MKYKQEKFIEGDFKGLKFYVPVFETIEEVVSAYTEPTCLALLNQQIQSRLRTKTKNNLPKNLPSSQLERFKEDIFQKYPDGCVLSQDQAKEWHPTVKELSARKLFLLSEAAVAAGEHDKARELMEQCKAKTLS